MKVSGRKADPDVAAGSAEVTPLCDPCRAQGKELEAHGFCNSCKEYMCPSCITVHGKLTATKHHNVLGKQEMPNHYPSSRKAVIKTIDFFTTTWSHEKIIDIKTREDTDSCFITGSTLLRPGVLLLADHYNCCVKTVDLTTGIVTARLTLDDRPNDVCVLPGDRAAVTLPAYPKSKIQFISTGKTLKSDKCIEVPAWCKGISYNDDKLYLSFTDTQPGIEIRTLEGDLLQMINYYTTFQRAVFSDPRYLTISRGDINTIYVSNRAIKTVVQLSLQGKELYTFSHKELNHPCGLVDVGGGQVLVCGWKSKTVMVISGRDRSMKTILGEKDGFNDPFTVAYCQTQKKLVVGGGLNDHVNVYTII